MLIDLFRHQAYADARLVSAIQRHAAAGNSELRSLLHHILVAHRYWLSLILQIRFNTEEESRVPDSLDEIAALYQETQARESEWLAKLDDSDLTPLLESPYFPERRIAVSEAMLQVCLHSQGHRSHAAALFRSLGGEPPPTDFIFWLQDRTSPVWV
ncbi:MAG TPA: DinB family protein [Bryobacteraceae bacterium]|jgi:uncharacterized damage-inducible protein DinB|nr:DinB family protein [Bryobacteraceae bacterium]